MVLLYWEIGTGKSLSLCFQKYKNSKSAAWMDVLLRWNGTFKFTNSLIKFDCNMMIWYYPSISNSCYLENVYNYYIEPRVLSSSVISSYTLTLPMLKLGGAWINTIFHGWVSCEVSKLIEFFFTKFSLISRHNA